MNILIVTDIEGVSGIAKAGDAWDRSSEGFQEARHKLMIDVNAAIRAAADSGAEEIYVNDGHNGGGNFIPEELDKRAIQIGVHDLPGIVRKVCAVVMVGYHAKAGTRYAFLDHTQSSYYFHHYYYNGKTIGELTQVGAYMGYFDIPCVAVTGDRAACIEAKEVFGENVATAETKYALVKNEAICHDIKETEKEIYEAVKKGIADRDKIPPLKVKLPLEVMIEFNTTAMCDEWCANNPHVERVDGYCARSVKTKIESFLDVLL
jgi:D-amino peptidase